MKLNAAEKARRAAERKVFDARNHFKPDDIVVNSWGWEQTNADFYTVLGVAKNRLVLQPIKSTITPAGPVAMHGTAVPDKTPKSDPITVGAYPWDHGKRVGVKFRHGSGELWDGEPERVSWYG